ncbi:MAG: hypothetical protein H6624_08745 [Bdellovibrionaceae bacterium]|nr:hypothetical protein [Bdellovibrionales bacterium]MCB9084420.1 hypothetical protein [Pseudobdellovibrionaceae bacterium]
MTRVRLFTSKLLVMGIFVVPMESGKDWQILKYRKIEPNKVEFSQEGLSIQVKNSASPVIFPLPSIMKLSAVHITGQIEGDLNLPEEIGQGEKGADDYQIRIGLVIKGDRRLNFVQKAMAADWVVKLFDLAPKDVGVDHILFLNGTRKSDHVGSKREHPASDLIMEQVVWKIPENGGFDLKHEFTANPDVLALWLSSDGDDTRSAYRVRFKKIELHPLESGGVGQAGADDAN